MDWQPLLIFPVLILVGGGIAWHFTRSFSLLQGWADENGFRIIQKEYRHLLRGPFFWSTSKGQTVYRVTVEDKAGYVRSGWVRCGGWWLGLMSNHVEVRWDAPPMQTKPDLSPMRDRWLDG